MLNFNMLGTAEKTETSRYQVTLVDKSNKNLHPMDYPRMNRFFDTQEERVEFMVMFETSVRETGGSIVENVRLSHPSFKTFEIHDSNGKTNYEVTVYA